MKKLLIGLTFLASMSSFAVNWPTEAELNQASAQAYLKTELWFCQAEDSYKEGLISVHEQIHKVAIQQCEDAKQYEKSSAALKVTPDPLVVARACADENFSKEEDIDVLNKALGCEVAIKKAKETLNASEIKEILAQHLNKIKMLKAFEKEVKTGKQYTQLVPSVKALKNNGLSLRLLKRHINLSEDELLIVELSFEKAKTKVERMLENL